MQAAYMEEVDKCLLNLDSLKMELETFYAKMPTEEAKIDGPMKETIEEYLSKAEVALNQFAGTAKSVKGALVSWTNFFSTTYNILQPELWIQICSAKVSEFILV